MFGNILLSSVGHYKRVPQIISINSLSVCYGIRIKIKFVDKVYKKGEFIMR